MLVVVPGPTPESQGSESEPSQPLSNLGKDLLLPQAISLSSDWWALVPLGNLHNSFPWLCALVFLFRGDLFLHGFIIEV